MQPDSERRDIDKMISASLLRLRMRSPFFATLALFARMIVTDLVPTAATDGRDVFINADFWRSLTPPQQDGLLLHEVLHAALRHVGRRGPREPLRWNIAADIVVNGIVVNDAGFALPEGAIRDEKHQHLSVEEIYDLIVVKKCPTYALADLDLKEGAERDATVDAHWRQALEQAKIVARAASHGTLPAALRREMTALRHAQLDWRAYLWRYLVRTPTDFQGFDRRFLSRGLYLDALEGERVHIYVAVDTSGSIDQEEINLLLGEVQGILRAYPHLTCDLYYADAAIYGPYELKPDSDIPPPIGGGGTDFRPFFARLDEEVNMLYVGDTTVAIYLTDGYGEFPATPPTLPVLWVLTPNGLNLDSLPFGEAVRLLRD